MQVYDNIELHSCLQLIFYPSRQSCCMGEVSVQELGSPEEGQSVQCFSFLVKFFYF